MRRVLVLIAALAVATACTNGPSPSPSTSSPASSSAGPTTPSPTPAPAVPIDKAMFGIHSYQGIPETNSGSIRLNCFPLWRDVEPTKGVYDWTGFDQAVARAQLWGFTDIVYSFCGTPEWAGSPVAKPDAAVFGPGSTSPPRKMSYWSDFVTAVVKRYKGRITAYESWNEPTTPQFFAGTPQQAAEMTAILHRVVKEHDPSALVVSAGVQTHRPDTWPYITAYVDALKQADWPVDIWNAHLYPVRNGTPASLRAQADRFREILSDAGAPDLPVWNTEVNYDVAQPGGEPDGRISGKKAAAWTAQTYLYALEWGISRTYWYLWTNAYYAFPGIQTRPGDPATAVLANLSTWLVGYSFVGCSRDSGVVTCRFDGSDPFTIVWSEEGSARVSVPAGSRACSLLTGTCATAPTPLTVDALPTIIR